MPRTKTNKETVKNIKKDLKDVTKEKRITKDHNLGDLVLAYPEVAEVLLDHGLHCVGCGAMHFDTIEAGAKLHGFTDEEVDELVLRINEVVEFKE